MENRHLLAALARKTSLRTMSFCQVPMVQCLIASKLPGTGNADVLMVAVVVVDVQANRVETPNT